ncbi:MAG TPA: AMP-binding protein [Gammaproteobacteria bacterium]|jgi:phenylacetate-CoA ligase
MRAREAARCARHLLWLARTRHWGIEQIRAYQRDALAAILEHAVATVPYYRELGIGRSSLRGDDAIEAFPILTKQLVQQHEARLISDAHDRAGLRVSRTSGSTGEPTSTFYDTDAWLLMKHALKLRRTLSHLRLPPYRVLVIGESPASPLAGPGFPLAGVRYIAIEDGVEAHLDVIRRFRPNGIYGTPSWLLEIVQTARHLDMQLPAARTVWTSAEVLTAAARTEIESGFGCRVRDVYGSTEFKEVAVECSFGRRHVNFETSYVEVMRDHGGGPGSLLITNLVNRAMPLIRYRIGDVGELASGPCPCGRAAPWIENIGGREVDLIELTGGRKISPYAFSTLIETDAAIARYRLLQRSATEVEVQYQLRPGATAADVTRLGSALRSAAEGRLEFSFSRVDRIERTAAGKHRILIRSADLE